jgi:hypothetical protein
MDLTSVGGLVVKVVAMQPTFKRLSQRPAQRRQNEPSFLPTNSAWKHQPRLQAQEELHMPLAKPHLPV